MNLIVKIFIACLGTETNTFSPIPTGQETFAETMLHHGDATSHEASLFSGPLHVWRRAAELEQVKVIESLAAFAQPAGITVRGVYEGLREEILDDLHQALPLEIVLINMHGAMVADGYDDCEGDLLARVREIVGPDVIIGAELDLHCHITDAMLANADAIVTFKEYPHTDPQERAQELYDMVKAKLAEMHGCLGELDSEDNSRPVDLDSLCSKLSKEWFAMSDAPTVIEGHLSHHLPVDGIVLLRCPPDELRNRLSERGYSE